MKNTILHYPMTMNLKADDLEIYYKFILAWDISLSYRNYHLTCRIKMHQPSCKNILGHKIRHLSFDKEIWSAIKSAFEFIDKNK